MIDWISNIPAPFFVATAGVAISLVLALVADLRDKQMVLVPLCLAAAILFAVLGIPAAALIAGFTIGEITTVVFTGFLAFGLGMVFITAVLIALFVIASALYPIR